MTPQRLASLIAKREGCKSQVTVGNVREVLRILGDLMAQDRSIGPCLRAYAAKRRAAYLAKKK